MSRTHDQSLLEALLDSWDRNNTILLNLLRALPEGVERPAASGRYPVDPVDSKPSCRPLMTCSELRKEARARTNLSQPQSNGLSR